MTLLVVPKSIPATAARPRNPILAMIPQTKMARPMNEGSNASIPPEGASEPCFCSDLDFRLLLAVRTGFGLDVVLVVTDEEESLSRFLRRCLALAPSIVVVFSCVVRHIQYKET